MLPVYPGKIADAIIQPADSKPLNATIKFLYRHGGKCHAGEMTGI
jgi:hypothetical protein